MDFLRTFWTSLQRRPFFQVVKNQQVRRWIWAGLFFAALTVILLIRTPVQQLDVAIGDPSPIDYFAPEPVENKIATDRARREAADSVPMIAKRDPTVQQQAEGFVRTTFQDIRTVRAASDQNELQKVSALAVRLRLGTVISTEVLTALVRATDQGLAQAEQDALSLIGMALGENVTADRVEQLKQQIDAEQAPLVPTTTDPLLRSFVKDLVRSRIKVNMINDMEQTADLKQRVANDVKPVMWAKGQRILTQGERVTEEQYEMLRTLGVAGGEKNNRSIFGSMLLAAIAVGLTGLLLLRFRPQVLATDSRILLVGLVGVLTLLLCILMQNFRGALGQGAAYLMPVAFSSILLTILSDKQVALFVSLIIAALGALFSEVEPLAHATVGIVGAAVGILAVGRVESRTDLYRAGLFVSIANMLTIMALKLMDAASLLDRGVWLDVTLGAANGLIVGVLVTGALPLFETLFGVLTPLKLLELSNPNHALLKRLLVEAPGSYHHTIFVANLCEAGAEAIGADAILARVGAYYHDIGKVKRPYFFVENQFGGENPHDKLPPSLSALIITSHVKDGVEMAREARLPREMIDFIKEHHGTMLVSYFYHMASKGGQSEYVLEDDFRYDGPKPQSKETAILMLADGCEASVRAMHQKSPLTLEQIEAQVRRIFDDRLKQGQLEECDLTFRDLEVLVKTFVRVLSGVHHTRIEYPTEASAPGAPLLQPQVEHEEANVDGTLGGERAGDDPGDTPDGGTDPEGDSGGPEAVGEPPR
jgi:putative nucleotidyltransferase with HDIG domain